jgi:hypothetical protein
VSLPPHILDKPKVLIAWDQLSLSLKVRRVWSRGWPVLFIVGDHQESTDAIAYLTGSIKLILNLLILASL